MEKKTTRRLIGVLVVVALIIILLPLMFNNNNTEAAPAQTAEANNQPLPESNANAIKQGATASTGTVATATPDTASQSAKPETLAAAIDSNSSPNTPASPDTVATNLSAEPAATTAEPQTHTLASNEDSASIGPSEKNVTTAEIGPKTKKVNAFDIGDNGEVTTSQANVIQDEPSKMKAAPMIASSQPTNAPVIINSSSDNATTPVVKTPSHVISQAIATKEPVKSVGDLDEQSDADEPAVAASTPVQTPSKATLATSAHVAPTMVKKDHNTVETLAAEKQSGWVIQMGSFRSQANVKRMMDQLNAHGYHPFTYETKSNGQTRVYIGPQFKRDEAAQLAEKIQHDVNLRGVVISYKPTSA